MVKRPIYRIAKIFMTRYNAAEQDARPQTIERFPASRLFCGRFRRCNREMKFTKMLFTMGGIIHLDARNNAIPRHLFRAYLLFCGILYSDPTHRYAYDNERV